MKKVNRLFIAVFLFAFWVLFPVKVSAGGGLVDFNISPAGPLNPGDKYNIDLSVYSDENYKDLCKGCQVQLKFVDNDGMGQPGDEILQESNTTDTLGRLKVTVTSYTVIPEVGGRQIYAVVTLSDGTKFSSSLLFLNYRNIPMLGFVRLIARLISQGYKLPPMGNIYPTVTKQRYLGGEIRQISLEMNRPFGTKSYAIYVFPEKDKRTGDYNELNNWYKQHLMKITTESKTEINANAFDNLSISILACSQTQPVLSITSATSCVGPFDVALPRLENPLATQSGEVSVPPNDEQQKNIQKEHNQFNNFFVGPIKTFLEGIYSRF